jgi:chromatin remodeling complex protein RSC6
MCITPTHHKQTRSNMARTKTTTATKESAPVIVASTPAVEAPAKKAKASRPAKESAKEEAPVAQPIVADVVADAEAVSEEVASSEKMSASRRLADELASLKANILARNALDSKIKSAVASLSKVSERLTREENKRSKGKKGTRTAGTGGFNSPVLISDALADFIGTARGSVVTRNSVNQFIHNYVKDNNLRVESDKRMWMYDTKLFDLFGKSSSDALGYFNLQTQLKPHFTKVDPKKKA